MIADDPKSRGRIAFTALLSSLCLIAADRTILSGNPSLIFLLAPVIAVIATGHIDASEAFIRTGISVGVVAVTGIVVNLSHGRGLPDYGSFGVLMNALTGLFALNLMIIVATSFAVKLFWPSSNHWTT